MYAVVRFSMAAERRLCNLWTVFANTGWDLSFMNIMFSLDRVTLTSSEDHDLS